jgi:hypothetical protein
MGITGKLPLLEVEIGDYGDDEAAMVRYREEGEARAAALGNRGPLTFTADGRVDPSILEAYDRTGFYVFEGVLDADELEDIERDVVAMLDNAPVTKGAALDRQAARRSGPTAATATSAGSSPCRTPSAARAPSTAGTRRR